MRRKAIPKQQLNHQKAPVQMIRMHLVKGARVLLARANGAESETLAEATRDLIILTLSLEETLKKMR